jgi:hypothetical protein
LLIRSLIGFVATDLLYQHLLPPSHHRKQARNLQASLSHLESKGWPFSCCSEILLEVPAKDKLLVEVVHATNNCDDLKALTSILGLSANRPTRVPEQYTHNSMFPF